MAVSSAQIAEVRAFNRDYTRRIGVLARGLLDSPYSLTQVRVMYEIAHRPGVMAAQLADELGLDRGYLSRILKGFAAKGLLARTDSAADARRQHLRLTPAGRRVFAPLERRSEQQVRAICGLPLGPTERFADAEMENLIGDQVDRWPTLIADPGARLHLYGKLEPRPGRKMGHVTRLLARSGQQV